MKPRWSLWRVKLAVNMGATFGVLKRWPYPLVAVGLAAGFWLFLYWSLNLNLLWFITAAPQISLANKFDVIFGSPAQGLAESGWLLGGATVLLVVLQSLALTLLSYNLRHENRLNRRAVGGSAVAGTIALLGVGCVSCGTSLLAPLLGLLFAGAAAELGRSAHAALTYLAVVAVLYAWYTSAAAAARVLASKSQNER